MGGVISVISFYVIVGVNLNSYVEDGCVTRVTATLISFVLDALLFHEAKLSREPSLNLISLPPPSTGPESSWSETFHHTFSGRWVWVCPCLSWQ